MLKTSFLEIGHVMRKFVGLFSVVHYNFIFVIYVYRYFFITFFKL